MSGNAFKRSLARPVLAGIVVAALAVVAAAPSPSPDDKVPPAAPSGEAFAKPWHIRLARPVMLAAWERLRNVEIPGAPADSRFRIDGTEYYVGPGGDDAADGSRDHPWKTLRFAVTRLKPGTVVNLLAGTYDGPVEVAAKATEASPAALRAAPGQEVVITYPETYIQQQKGRIARLGGEGAVDAGGKELHYPSLITVTGTYVEVSGLHFVGARDRLPMNLYSESGISLAGGGGRGCRVLYNEIENTGHCGVKEMGHGGTAFLIEGNYIHDLGLTAHDHAIYLPADDVTVRRNLLVNAAGWGVHAYTAPRRLTISHNIIGGNAEDSVILGGPECKVLNNILYKDRKGGVFFFRRECRGNVVANNILVEPAAFRYDAAGSSAPADQPQSNVIDYNCIVAGPGAVLATDGMGTHNIKADPQFVDADKLDFRLKPGSPCTAAGDPKVMEKSAGKAPDIGLCEVK
jgi:nitrous oxidase accessory protein NosD